jgi:cholesterol oxidase
VQVHWPGLPRDPVLRRAEAALAELARFERARVVVPPRRRIPVSVHPLGGCPMADDVEHGVVDATGRVHDPAGGRYAGLYVLDGSICPTALGVNPSLAIAALAECAMQEIVTADLPALGPLR